MQFPSRENLKKSEDGTEYIYGGSVAINRFLGHLQDRCLEKTDLNYKCFLINVFTLCENIYKLDVSDIENFKLLKNELSILVKYIDIYIYTKNIKNAKLLFYIPSYEKVPSERKRKIKEGTKKHGLKKFYLKVVQGGNIGELGKGITTSSSLEVFLNKIGNKKKFPHESLNSFLNLYSGEKINALENCLLISHIYLDYELLNLNKHVKIFLRYYDKILKREDLNKKLVKDYHIPFSLYSLSFFGDSSFIEPILKRNIRKKVLELLPKKVNFSNNFLKETITKVYKDKPILLKEY